MHRPMPIGALLDVVRANRHTRTSSDEQTPGSPSVQTRIW